MWQSDGELLGQILGALHVKVAADTSQTDVFFTDCVPVPPSKYRPVSMKSRRTHGLKQKEVEFKLESGFHKVNIQLRIFLHIHQYMWVYHLGNFGLIGPPIYVTNCADTVSINGMADYSFTVILSAYFCS